MLASLESTLKFENGRPGPYEVVLESGAIRLLPRAEAQAFWRAWWGK
jgi:hypothetical protein